jgi:hypothetical protein
MSNFPRFSASQKMRIMLFSQSYDWRFTANQFVLASSPLRLTTSISFSTEPLHSPYVTSSLTRRWVCPLSICLAFRQVYISHVQYVIENSSFFTTHRSSISTGFTEQIMPNLHILCYNGSLVIWMVVSLTTAKFKPLIFSMSGFILSYTANIFILMILYDFWSSPGQFCYIISD